MKIGVNTRKEGPSNRAVWGTESTYLKQNTCPHRGAWGALLCPSKAKCSKQMSQLDSGLITSMIVKEGRKDMNGVVGGGGGLKGTMGPNLQGKREPQDPRCGTVFKSCGQASRRLAIHKTVLSGMVRPGGRLVRLDASRCDVPSLLTRPRISNNQSPLSLSTAKGLLARQKRANHGRGINERT